MTRRNVALTGGAAIAAGLLLGFVVERFRRLPQQSQIRLAPVRGGSPAPPVPREEVSADLLERYRAAAAV
jgi:hypothetical protein